MGGRPEQWEIGGEVMLVLIADFEADSSRQEKHPR